MLRMVLRDIDLGMICLLVHFLLLLLHCIAYDLIVEVSIHGSLLLGRLRCVWALAEVEILFWRGR